MVGISNKGLMVYGISNRIWLQQQCVGFLWWESGLFGFGAIEKWQTLFNNLGFYFLCRYFRKSRRKVSIQTDPEQQRDLITTDSHPVGWKQTITWSFRSADVVWHHSHPHKLHNEKVRVRISCLKLVSLLWNVLSFTFHHLPKLCLWSHCGFSFRLMDATASMLILLFRAIISVFVVLFYEAFVMLCY